MDLKRRKDMKKTGEVSAEPVADERLNAVRYHRLWTALVVLSAISLVVAVYLNTLHAPFMFDDYQNILENPHIRLEEITLAGLKDAGFNSFASRRPLVNISFALNYFFHGYDLPGYHIVNILIHIITGLLFYFLLRSTIILSRKQSQGRGMMDGVDPAHVACFAMLIWLVHPLGTQSVTYIVQRMASMAALFYILSLQQNKNNHCAETLS